MNKSEKNKEPKYHNFKLEVIGLTVMYLIIISLLNFLIIVRDKSYYYLALFIAVTSIVITILNLTIGLNRKFFKIAKYIGITLLSNLFSFSFYLNLTILLNANLIHVKIIIILNYILLEIILIYKRIIRKDQDYINSVSSGSHGKYVKKDIIFVVVISAVIILFAKLIDNGHIHVGRIGIMVTEILGTPLMTIAIVLHVHTFANYLYNIKTNSEN